MVAHNQVNAVMFTSVTQLCHYIRLLLMQLIHESRAPYAQLSQCSPTNMG